jgi:beta-lactamase superfamily II metal-dependent hydrolase
MTDVGTERFHPTESANCQIVRVADGSFLIFDSAYGNRDETEDLIYDILKKQAPDPDHIVISAWLFTHAHADHVGGFCYFADKYAGQGDIELRQVVCNFPDDSVLNACDSNMQKRTIDAAKRLNENVTFIKAHIGDILYYADVKIEILYTQEQVLAANDFLGNYNATSCVYRLITEDGVTYLCGGDHNVNNQHVPYYGCEGAIYRWYGSFIESDIVGAFHHGYGGGADMIVYHFVKPKLVLWPVSWSCIRKASLLAFSLNLYFTDPEQAKEHNVDYFISGDTIHVFHFNNGAFTVTEYETADEYFNS